VGEADARWPKQFSGKSEADAQCACRLVTVDEVSNIDHLLAVETCIMSCWKPRNSSWDGMFFRLFWTESNTRVGDCAFEAVDTKVQQRIKAGGLATLYW
jgi:hypothetical protein